MYTKVNCKGGAFKLACSSHLGSPTSMEVNFFFFKKVCGHSFSPAATARFRGWRVYNDPFWRSAKCLFVFRSSMKSFKMFLKVISGASIHAWIPRVFFFSYFKKLFAKEKQLKKYQWTISGQKKVWGGNYYFIWKTYAELMCRIYCYKFMEVMFRKMWW